MRKRIIVGILVALMSSSVAAAYSHAERFSVWKVAATERGYTWLVREKERTMQLFDAQGLYAQTPSNNGEPSMGGGILRTESEHGDSYTTFTDYYGHVYEVQSIATCDEYPFSMSEVCE